MTRPKLSFAFFAAVVFALALPQTSMSQTLGTAFTYQGSLRQSGAPLTGTPSMRFGLWNDPDSGEGTELFFVVLPAVAVDAGLFTATLDFGAEAFTGSERWLEIGVDAAGGTSFTTLTPRQRLAPTPNALFAKRASWTGLDDIPPGFADGTDDGATDHGALGGLGDDDHTQYLLASGARSLGGDLDLAGNDVNNPGLIGGVAIAAHAARHAPGGADAIPTAAPATVGSANAEGSAATLARADHVHAHGDQAGGTLHAVATQATAGFLSAADKTKLDGLAPAGGYLFAVSTFTQTIPLFGVFLNVSFDTLAASDGWISGPTNFTALSTGTYLFQYDMRATKFAGGIANVSARLARNGVEILGSQSALDLDTTNSAAILSNGFIADVLAGDNIQVQFGSSNSSLVEIAPGGMGSMPTSASLTITRLR